MMSGCMLRISRLPKYGFQCHRAGLISFSRPHLNSGITHIRKQVPTTSTLIQPTAFSSDLASKEYKLIYAFPPIKILRALSRLKLLQTGFTMVLLPAVYYLHLQGQASLVLLNRSVGIAIFAAVMLYSISHFVRRVVGMMYLDSSQTILKVSHLTFWGRRGDLYVPVSDVIPLGESGDAKGESILQLKRYSKAKTMYFSTRIGRVLDKQSFEKVFGSSV